MAYSEFGHLPEWTKDKPARFWDSADEFERANGTVYREIEFALPKELSEPENIDLARTFAETLANVPGGATPYTLAIHRSEKDPRLLHCHLMLSDKINDGIRRDAMAWFKRAANKGKDPATGGAPKTQARISHEWLGETVRPLWEGLANDALARAGHTARIDRRTLEEQLADQERIAAQALLGNDAPTYLQAIGRAAALDHQPQPKLGRVYTHKGAKKAPGQAAMLAEYEAIDAEQRREAERVAELRVEALVLEEELQKAQAILERAKERQQGREVVDQMQIQERWHKRREARQNRQRDIEAAAEQRPGIRHPDRPQWQVYRERVLTEAYNRDVAQALGRWVKVERVEHGLHLHNRQMDLMDHGDRITAGLGGQEKEIAAMLQLARAKDWQSLMLTGSQDFQERAGAAALAAGFELADAALKERILEGQRQREQAQAEQAKEREREAQRLAAEAERRRRDARQEFEQSCLAPDAQISAMNRMKHAEIVAAYVTATVQMRREQIGKDWEVRQQRKAIEKERRAQAERRERIIERARVRQGYRFEPWAIRERWSFRQQQREQRIQDELAFERFAAAQAAERERLEREAEEAAKAQRQWIEAEPLGPLVWDVVAGREKRKTLWQEWREKTLTERYGPELAAKAESAGEDWYIRLRPDLGGLNIRDKAGREVIDAGSIIKAEHPSGETDIPLMIELVKAKGWTEVAIEGGEAFRLKMAMAVLENGLSVSDKALAEQARAEIEQQQPQEQSLPFDYKAHGIDDETPKQDLKKGQTLE